MMTRFAIKTRLLVNSGLLLGLFVLALVVHQFALGRVETTFARVAESQRHYNAKAWSIKTAMQETRRAVSEFALHRELMAADQVEQGLIDMQRLSLDIRQYAEATRNREFATQAEAIADAVTAFGRIFRDVRETQVRRGLNPDVGLMGRMRDTAHRLWDENTMEHAVDPLLKDLFKVQTMLLGDGPADVKARNDALDSAMALFVQRFNTRVPNTEKYQELYGWFAAYQLSIHYYLVAASNPNDRARIAQVTAAVERDYLALGNGLLRNDVGNIEALVLQIRRYEKDYIERGDQGSLDKTRQAVQAVRQAFADSDVPQADRDDVNRILDDYLKDFEALVTIDQELVDLDDRLQAESRHVEDAVATILATAMSDDEHAEVEARSIARMTSLLSIGICVASMLVGLWLTLAVNRTINRPLHALLEALTRVTQGDYRARITELATDEIGRLGTMFNRMAEAIGASYWLTHGRNQISEQLREDKEEERLCRDIIVFLAHYLGAQVGAFHVAQPDGALRLAASFSLATMGRLPQAFRPGEGLVGEAALHRELMVINDLPPNYLRLESGLGGAVTTSLVLLPVIWLKEVRGVVELASCIPFTQEQLQFLSEVAEAIAIALYSCRQRQETILLLAETQRQAAILQTQQEELRAANEELEEQTQALRQNEEELKTQQEELQAANEELEEKSESLVRQNKDIEEKNHELEEAWKDIDGQARELAAASRYKSEFLANMSHELRTPLNSLLLLARNLAQNKGGNLESSQVESAQIIHNSGQDLLRLINDILDLSKIEAGRMDVHSEEIGLRGLGDWLRANFVHLMTEKGLQFAVTVSPDLPLSIRSDRMRLEQVLRNLVANAVKFTEQGGVTVCFFRPPPEIPLVTSGLDPHEAIAIAVQDTGIGITPEQQQVIFDAFKQAEGGTARRYGGTGLGLSISKKLTELLGGEVQLTSEKGRGSTFTLYLPLRQERVTPAPVDPGAVPVPPVPAPLPHDLSTAPAIPDDREALAPGDKCLLIVEDDCNFARILLAQGRAKGFKCLVAVTGHEGVRLAKLHAPGAVILDIRLPDIDGWQVLDALKNDPGLRHIPVHMTSGQEKTMEAFKKGAIGFLSKPVSEEEMLAAFARLEDVLSKRMRELLVVEDDMVIRQGICDLIGNGDVTVTPVASGGQAIIELQHKRYDCMILDIGLPDMSGFALLDRLSMDDAVAIPPVIIYTGRELTREEGMSLAKYTDTVIIKGVKSEERLLDETALFLHRVVSKLPVEKRRMIASLYDQDTMFRDKRIMVVDDDMRNAFALSRILEERGMRIIIANDGRHALELLDKDPQVDLILMDIMMPVLDGYQTTAKIREQERFWNLPIIALTAKALPEDKEKCMAAGASDYLAKPVDEDRLLAMMRVWLYR
jgi:CheY-like chemotaxis protein